MMHKRQHHPAVIQRTNFKRKVDWARSTGSKLALGMTRSITQCLFSSGANYLIRAGTERLFSAIGEAI